MINNSDFSLLGFLGGLVDKECAYNAGDPGSVPGLGKSPGEGNGYPLEFLPGEVYGYRGMVGYCSWGHKEWDTTERLTRAHTHTHTCTHTHTHTHTHAHTQSLLFHYVKT